MKNCLPINFLILSRSKHVFVSESAYFIIIRDPLISVQYTSAIETKLQRERNRGNLLFYFEGPGAVSVG